MGSTVEFNISVGVTTVDCHRLRIGWLMCLMLSVHGFSS